MALGLKSELYGSRAKTSKIYNAIRKIGEKYKVNNMRRKCIKQFYFVTQIRHYSNQTDIAMDNNVDNGFERNSSCYI